jgi:SAM-dependent methyltransferase
VTGAALVVQGDALHLPLPDGSVDLAISSPPYFNLRSYGAGPGEIGNERTPAEFLEALWAATRELVRVLKPTGSIFINLGDKYAGGGGQWENDERPDPNRRRIGKTTTNGDAYGLRPKSLLGLPWAYALGCTGMLANLGGPDPGLNLILRAPIVLHKVNSLPESVRDRVRTSDQELLFHLVKQPRYYSALDELREPHVYPDDTRHLRGGRRSINPDGTPGGGNTSNGNPLGKLPGSVWSMASEPLRLPEWLGVNHYAAFSSELPRRVVLGFSPPGICLECDQGRVPVVEREAQGRERHGAGDGGRGNRLPGYQDIDRVPWAENVTATILGYACSCTPFTDHPGTGEPSGPYGRHANAIAAGVASESTGQHWGGNQDYGARPKVGPWREYHLDGWRAPPTRPSVVLDPFSGTGTVPMVSRALGRIGVGVDLSHSYCRAARWRVHHDAGKAISRTWVERQGQLL